MEIGVATPSLSRFRCRHSRARRTAQVFRFEFGQFQRLEERALLSTLVQSATFGPALAPQTNANLAPPLNQFDDQGGARLLESVDVTAHSQTTATLAGSIINASPTQTATFTAQTTNASTSISGPGISSPVSSTNPLLLDFTTPVAPNQTVTVPLTQKTLTADGTSHLTSPADLAPFIGTGTLAPYTTSTGATSTTDLSGSSNATVDGVFTATGSAAATVTYTFAQPSATISITPSAATNPVNTAHVFTIAVTAQGDGATPTFSVPTVTFAGAAPGTVGPVTLVSTVTNADGSVTRTWTETINSSTPGTFVASAHDNVTFTTAGGGTLTLSRTTDGLNGDSGSATKVYTPKMFHHHGEGKFCREHMGMLHPKHDKPGPCPMPQVHVVPKVHARTPVHAVLQNHFHVRLAM